MRGTGWGQTADNSAITPQVELAPPPPIITRVQLAPTAGAVNIVWRQVLHPIRVNRLAISHNKVAPMDSLLTVTKRPAAAVGESGGNGGN
jgi:hypothetical protein